jgi:hypothetical protein
VGDCELALTDAVAEPVEAHVNALRFFLLDGVVGQPDGELIDK